MLHSITAVIVTNTKHYLIWYKPILIFIFKCKRTAVHFQVTPVYESILRYIINRGVCKTSNDLSGVFSFFFHITKVPVCQNKTTMERSLINIRDSFLFHQFLNQKKIIIINDQRTIFFSFYRFINQMKYLYAFLCRLVQSRHWWLPCRKQKRFPMTKDRSKRTRLI